CLVLSKNIYGFLIDFYRLLMIVFIVLISILEKCLSLIKNKIQTINAVGKELNKPWGCIFKKNINKIMTYHSI
ncbi:MAG: hypothetical protein LUP91_00280, partial [Methylococcaceae bacterium]|nr:hypothetical protein [Methylococcaceae bacterium]